MGNRAEELRKELAVEELAEKVRAAKEAGEDVPRDLKHELREARLRWRAERDGQEVVEDAKGRLRAQGDVQRGDVPEPEPEAVTE